MGSLQFSSQGEIAACSFDADATTPAFLSNVGFSSFVRNGVGDYTFTLAGVNSQNLRLQGNVQCTVQGALPGIVGVEYLTVSTFRVRVLSSAAAAADYDFWLRCAGVGPQ